MFYPKATVTDVSEPVAALEVWKPLWEKTTVHNGDAGWLKSVDIELHSLIRQPNFRITLMHIQKSLKCMHNWRAFGNNFIHSFWLKNCG